MYEQKLNELREIYKNLHSNKEENVKFFVVVPFLEMLGYKKEWMDLENDEGLLRSPKDICIFINNKKQDKLFIETKNKGDSLSPKDIGQLIDYLHRIGVQWGILSNGKNYLLLNDHINSTKKIDVSFEKKIIFKYDLFSNDIYILKLYNYNSLFDLKLTHYYKYYAMYKAVPPNKNEDSIKQYQGTLNVFFKYLVNMGEYIELDKLRLQELNAFFIEDKTKKVINNRRTPKYTTTFNNKYAHIKNLFDVLFKYNFINDNPFLYFTKEQLFSNIELTENNSSIEPLTDDEVRIILKTTINDVETIRNRIIILILLFYGLDKRYLINIKTKDFDYKTKTIKVDKINIPLTDSISALIKEYIEIRKNNKENSPYLFCTKYYGSFKKLDTSTVNDIVNNEINKCDLSEDRKKQITPSFLKTSIIKRMFEGRIHIEEIKIMTGLSLESISKYITDEDISKNINYKRLKKCHPYLTLLTDSNLCDAKK